MIRYNFKGMNQFCSFVPNRIKNIYNLLPSKENKNSRFSIQPKKSDGDIIKNGDNDEFRELQEESRRGFETKGWRERSETLDDDLRGRLSGILAKEIWRRGYGDGDDNGLLTLKGKGEDRFEVFQNVDGDTFHDGIGKNHNEPKVAFMVLSDKEVTLKAFGKDFFIFCYLFCYLFASKKTKNLDNIED